VSAENIMKILYIANSRIPTQKAHGIQIMKMCEALSNKKNNLELIAPTNQLGDFKNVDPFTYYQVEKKFKIKKIISLDPTWLMNFPQGIYTKFQSIFFIISLFFYLIFKKNKKEYIFYTRDEYLLHILQLFSKQVIWESHSLPSKKKHYLKYWQKCSKIITISQSLKNELIKLGINKDKIINAPDGVDLEKFNKIKFSKQELRKKLNLSLDKNIIIYTGHLFDWKGVQTLAQSSQFLSDNEQIVFVGGTQYDIKNFKAQIKDFKNILILGHQSYSKIPLYLKAADVLVLPNSAAHKKSKLWTSPLKMFEYMASNTPIVASNLPSIKEILNKQNALLIKPDDENALAKGIQQILQDKDLANKLSKQAHKDVQDYTWEKRAEGILA